MSYHNTLMLFGDDNMPQKPLPLQIAQQYSFPLQHHQVSDDVMLYSIQDWIMGVAQTGEPQQAKNIFQYIKKRAGSVLSTLTKMPYTASDGKVYKMDFADDVALYSITQRMSTNTGIRDNVMSFLASAGAFVDELRQDSESAQHKIANYRQARALKSGKEPAWIAQRETGVITRNELIALVVKVCPEMNIGELTNIGYKGTLGTDAKGLRQKLEIGPKQNPRDHMSEVALAYTMVHEATVRAHLMGMAGDDLVPPQIVRKVVQTAAESIGKQAQETAALIGIDLVSGRKILGTGAQ